jgi:hypothetical protein
VNNPFPENSAGNTADQIINAVVFDFAVNAAIASLDAQFPILAAPFICSVVRMIISGVGKHIANALSQFVTFQIIDFQIAGQKDAYHKAEAELRQAHLSGDPVAIEKARSDFSSALSRIIHYDGA